MKSQLTEEVKTQIARFLMIQIIRLEESKQIGNKHYNRDQDVKLINEAIMEMAKTIWE